MNLSFAFELKAIRMAVQAAPRPEAPKDPRAKKACETREQIKKFMENGAASVPAISKALGLNEATIHHHIRRLVDDRVLVSRNAQRGRVYFLKSQQLQS